MKFHHNFTTIGLRMLAGHGADMLSFVKKVKVKNNTRKALIEGRLSIDWSLWNDRYATDFLYLKVKIIV